MNDLARAAINDQHDELIGQVVEEYFEAVERGERLPLEHFVSRYPDIQDVLKSVIPALQMADGTDAVAPANDQHPRRLGDFRILRQIGRGGMGIVYEAEQISMGRRVALKVLPLAGLVDDLKIQRFHNEVRAVAALDHPHIVSVYTVGEERGVHYYAMQLIRGRSLEKVLSSLREMREGEQVLDGLSVDQLSSIRGSSDDATQLGDVDQLAGDNEQTWPTHKTEVTTVAIANNSTISRAKQHEYFRSVAALGVQAASALEHAHKQGVIHRDVKPANLMLDGSSQLYVTDFGLARVEAEAGVTIVGRCRPEL